MDNEAKPHWGPNRVTVSPLMQYYGGPFGSTSRINVGASKHMSVGHGIRILCPSRLAK
jgi:hypothetical protein